MWQRALPGTQSRRSGKTQLCRAFQGLSQDCRCLQSCSSLHLQLWGQNGLWYQKSQDRLHKVALLPRLHGSKQKIRYVRASTLALADL